MLLHTHLLQRSSSYVPPPLCSFLPYQDVNSGSRFNLAFYISDTSWSVIRCNMRCSIINISQRKVIAFWLDRLFPMHRGQRDSCGKSHRDLRLLHDHVSLLFSCTFLILFLLYLAECPRTTICG